MVIKTNKKVKLSRLDKFNKDFPKILRFISGLSLIIFTLLKTFLTTVGLLVILVLLAIVEVNRVQSGITLFEEVAAFALYAAVVLVMLNVVVEFIIHHKIMVSSTVPKQPVKASLRLFKQSIAYRLGIGHEWEEQPSNPAEGLIRVQRLITFSIIALALSGSMKDEIAMQGSTVWTLAIVNIIFYSSLQNMMTWVSGLLFTITAVISAQTIAKYIAVQAAQAEVDMQRVSMVLSNKEKGIRIVSLEVVAKRHKGLRGLTNINKDDKVQLNPVFKFHDAIEDSWSREYKSWTSLQNFIVKVDEKRTREN